MIDGKIVVSNRKAADIVTQLKAHKYPTFKEEAAAEDGATGGYYYLLRMPIYTLTYEKKKELEKEADDLKMAMEALRAKPIQHIWRDELQQFKDGWEAHKKAIEEEYEADRLNKPVAVGPKRRVVSKK